MPVYAERGRAGGFALLDGYRTKLTGLTPAEAQALLLAGAGGAAADLGIGAEAAAAQLKMLASLPAESGASATRVGARFHLDPASWYARAEAPEILPSIASAVWNDRRIRIRYESWKDVVTRDLDPLGVVLKGGVWYLVAASEHQPRTYRVSNIRALDLLDTSFKRPRALQSRASGAPGPETSKRASSRSARISASRPRACASSANSAPPPPKPSTPRTSRLNPKAGSKAKFPSKASSTRLAKCCV